MSLSDAQIERYARQIVLPEVGGRGQERLLAARVGLFVDSDAEGARDTAILTALHLGAAGVGGLGLDERSCGDVAAALAARNPEVRVVANGPLDATIALGDDPALLARRPSVFGGADAMGAVAVLPRARCAACLAAALPALVPAAHWPRALPPILAPLVATLALRELLELGEREAPLLVTIGVGRAAAATTPVAARPGCPDCKGF